VLGSQRVVGTFEGDSLAFRLEGDPGASDGMHGVVACPATRTARRLVCVVQASSGDGNLLRSGTAELLADDASPPE
jgi:hypothetical protein